AISRIPIYSSGITVPWIRPFSTLDYYYTLKNGERVWGMKPIYDRDSYLSFLATHTTESKRKPTYVPATTTENRKVNYGTFLPSKDARAQTGLSHWGGHENGDSEEAKRGGRPTDVWTRQNPTVTTDYLQKSTTISKGTPQHELLRMSAAAQPQGGWAPSRT